VTADSGSAGDRPRGEARAALFEALRKAGAGIADIYADPDEPGRDARSMEPHLRPGDAVAWSVAGLAPAFGDLALYADSARSGLLVVHRVVGGSLAGRGLLTKGDGRPEADEAPVAAGALVGRVVAIRCRGDWFDVGRGGARAYARLIAALSSFAGGAFRALAPLDRVFAPRRADGRPLWIARRLAWWLQHAAIRIVKAALFRVCHRRLDAGEVVASFGHAAATRGT